MPSRFMSTCVAFSIPAVGPGPPIRPSLFISTPNFSSILSVIKSDKTKKY